MRSDDTGRSQFPEAQGAIGRLLKGVRVAGAKANADTSGKVLAVYVQAAGGLVHISSLFERGHTTDRKGRDGIHATPSPVTPRPQDRLCKLKVTR